MSGAFSSPARNGMLTAPPVEAVNDLPQNSEHKPEQTDMLTSNTDTNTDTDTEAGSTLDTDSETECDLDTERHTDSPGCAGQTDADNNDNVTQSDTLRETETDTSTDRQPRTKGDLHIRSVLECGREVMVCQFNNEGTLLAVGLSDGTIKVYSIDSGSLVQTLKDRDSILSPLPVTALRFSVSLQSHSLLLATCEHCIC
ncbi:serine-aspartate repeat-containing protein C-like [Megalops cyprinoides]|uniref:serine-aspartate repeat-containing protein C-like n=1 Tax=Megalops cyprinoides TaxID=118141 RepID=UPI0018652A38|nr:serine-aspartate repeat-containing protein C-like [Megalops cyprinoides]